MPTIRFYKPQNKPASIFAFTVNTARIGSQNLSNKKSPMHMAIGDFSEMECMDYSFSISS